MQPFNIVLVSCLLKVAAFADQGEFPSSRIVGGEKADEWDNFQYQVSIQREDFDGNLEHVCGGSIINKKWILTAAQCVYHEERDYIYFVKAGVTRLNSTYSQLAEVAKVIINQGYIEYPGFEHKWDIALLKLKKPLVLNENVRAVKLPKPDDTFDGYATFTGWGFTDPHGVEANTLRKIVLPLVHVRSCKNYFTTRWFLFGSNICTMPLEPNKKPWHGDEGGPLVKFLPNGLALQIGIYIYMERTPLGTKSSASIYVNVAYHVEWIDLIMWDEETNPRKNKN